MRKKIIQIRTFYDLAFKAGIAVKLVNLVTIYRILAFPLLILLIFREEFEWFKWLLALSFFTDAIDGFLARKFKAGSILGSRLDSVGDDLTVAAGAIGMIYKEWGFFREQWPWIAVLFFIFVVQMGYALIKYGRQTSFHTYGAKVAAVLQGLFLLSIFFLEDIQYWLYYLTLTCTALQILEEMIMIYLLPEWKNDVKGIYWARKK
jgi:phosphatidylglycerophosphate synthase